MFPVAVLLASLAPSAPEPKTITLTVGELKREALVYAPAKSSAAPPLVFAFHGHGGNMRQASRSLGINAAWLEAVVVYPQGLPTPGQLSDPDGMKNGWQAKAGDQGDRDLKFFDALLNAVKKDYNTDDKRVYSTGHSNGGGFTFLLWAQRGDTFAAVAPSGAVARYVAELKPKPCLHVAGENDPLVKFAWQQVMMDRVKKLNGCAATGKEWAKAGKLTGTLYESKGGTPFVSLIGPITHTFPATDAPKLIVKFFQDHAKK